MNDRQVGEVISQPTSHRRSGAGGLNRRTRVRTLLSRDRIGACLIFILALVVFRLSPIHTIYDSKFEMLFSQELLWHRSFSLEARQIPPELMHEHGRAVNYRFVKIGERLYYHFPPGGIVLSAPFVALANAIGISASDENGVYSASGDETIQQDLASLLMAGLATIIFLTSRMVLSFRWSLLIALTSAFGTQVWSSASRAVWAQTWGIFILGFVLWQVMRAEVKQKPLRPVLLATCLSWLYFCRPTFSIAIVAIALYVLIYNRKQFWTFALTGAAWLSMFIGYSEFLFHRLLPEYYGPAGLSFGRSFKEALPANVVSPSRGLLIYVPILWFIGYLLLRYGKYSRRALAVMGASVIAIHIVVISGYTPWHSGHSYGPRLSTDLVPWFALLGMLSVEARLGWRQANPQSESPWRLRAEWGFAILLLVCSLLLNGIGATSRGAWQWNSEPVNIDDQPERVWDWKHPQFLGAPPPGSSITPGPEFDRGSGSS